MNSDIPVIAKSTAMVPDVPKHSILALLPEFDAFLLKKPFDLAVLDSYCS